MKVSTVLGVAAATSLAAASPLRRQSNSTFAKVDGLKFNIDGVTQYYAGTNAYWLAFTTGNDDIDTALDRLKESGLKILRIWGFNDVNTVPTDGKLSLKKHLQKIVLIISTGTVWFQSFVDGQDPVINTGTDGLQRLDYVVKSAEQRGIKLVINFVNNWTDYGGMAAYMKRFGGSANPDWYANADIQAQYKKYIKTVVSRYSNSSAVFSWELANEPRCNGCNTVTTPALILHEITRLTLFRASSMTGQRKPALTSRALIPTTWLPLAMKDSESPVVTAATLTR